MPSCHIVPDQWGETCTELLLLWRRWEGRGQLIDLDLARLYFRTPEVLIDARIEPPIITTASHERACNDS